LTTMYTSYNVDLTTSSSLDPTVESITSTKDSSTDSNTPQEPQLCSLMTSPPVVPAPGTLVTATAQACVLLTSTWELRTVSHATTPASTDALTVTHVPTTLATLTVPHVAAQDPTNVPHATVTQPSLMVAAHVMQATSETPTTVNSPPVKSTDVTSVLRTTTNTHVSCVKTTSSTSKTTTKDSDTVSTATMMTSTHTQPVVDVNATKSSSTTLMMSSTTHVTVTMTIISLMDTVPLVDKTVTTVTSTAALSVTSDSTTITPKPSVSTSAQLAQSTTPPATVENA
jgi:hypothetical protein